MFCVRCGHSLGPYATDYCSSCNIAWGSDPPSGAIKLKNADSTVIYQLAPRWRRALAFCADLLFVFLMFYGVFWALSRVYAWIYEFSRSTFTPDPVGTVLLITSAAGSLWVYVAIELSTGGNSIGKMLLEIKVVGADSHPLSKSKILARFLLRMLDCAILVGLSCYPPLIDVLEPADPSNLLGCFVTYLGCVLGSALLFWCLSRKRRLQDVLTHTAVITGVATGLEPRGSGLAGIDANVSFGSTANPPDSTRTRSLGIALAGGGFRAAFFHAGVLRRLAELDVLRNVRAISAVSGGSVIGALYTLLLRREQQRTNSPLSRDQYVRVVLEAIWRLLIAVQKDLRNRLFWSPLGLLATLLPGGSLAKRMITLYERHLFAIPALQLSDSPLGVMASGRIRLRQLNAIDRSDGITLILNATSLNSGQPFRMGAEEIGDTGFGVFRYDLIESDLLLRKQLFNETIVDLTAALMSPSRDQVNIRGTAYPRDMVEFTAWWRNRLGQQHTASPFPLLDRLSGFPPANLFDGETLDFQALRLAEKAASDAIHNCRDIDRKLEHYAPELLTIFERVSPELITHVDGPPALCELCQFIVQVYRTIVARRMSGNILRDYETTTVGEAVGASACFPPFFAPMTIRRFYDESLISALSLSDGGVYDNTGIDALLEKECTEVIISDTSGELGIARSVGSMRTTAAGRIIGVLMNSAARNRGEMLRQMFPERSVDRSETYSEAPRRLVAFNMVSTVGPELENQAGLAGGARRLLAKLRTDLDAFGDLEICGLINDGYITAEEFVGRRNLSEAVLETPAEYPVRCLAIDSTSSRLTQSIIVGMRRFAKGLLLQGPFFSLLLLLSPVAVLWLIRHVSLQSPTRTVARNIFSQFRFAEEVTTFVWRRGGVPLSLLLSALSSASFGRLLAVVAIIGFLLWFHVGFCPSVIIYLRQRGMSAWAKRLVILRLGLIYLFTTVALIIANLAVFAFIVLVPICAFTIYICDSIPYLRMTRAGSLYSDRARVLADLLDTLVLIDLYTGLFALADSVSGNVFLLGIAIVTCLPVVGWTYMECIPIGATPGKLMLGLRVVDECLAGCGKRIVSQFVIM